ncbi:Peptidase M28 family protein [Flavobacterium sp. 9AF]|uniref:M20/M25/M40 family metallo-hydrolase n=1 Tax=Flavobacterium sp. 9AF TaxID=2653142 RepID=UPI0012F2E760|nr:M20/M25/M40 family metallo-hydrolase [Flavobacterium sp. 9AF]VXC26199.1 Peptidase M28 family protein [Flavobacterium sp. 9AF]
MRFLLFFIIGFCINFSSNAQSDDEKMLQAIYNEALSNSKCYNWLDYLSNTIGSRLSGSSAADKAVGYTKKELDELGLDRVFLQEVMVPHWVRGEKEKAYFENKGKITEVPICALGSSVATPKNGLKAAIVEVQGIDEMIALGTEKIKGKIVFFNRPMTPIHIRTFEAYRGCIDQRSSGAREASKLGALGVIVRSMNLRLDDFPHTGNTNYGDLPNDMHIPAAAISTNGANLLSQALRDNPNLQFFFKQSCEMLPDVLSHNVVGEIKGTENPNEYIVVGGHLDSWDLGDGSHDDGAGVVQSMEILSILKRLGYKPKRTIRVVLFMNEENGNRGGLKYAELAEKNKENHIFAMESDAGGFSPRGFSLEADSSNFNKIKDWKRLFEPYLIHVFVEGHAGVDINPLQSKHIVKAGLQPDSQRYFDYHHAANDTFDAVNKRELELGAATMTSLLYLMDKYGIE